MVTAGLRPRTRVTLGLAAVAVVLGPALVVAPSVALILAPALVLLAVLLAGFFPGEDALARARSSRAGRPARLLPVSRALPAFADIARPAGVTLAYALAVRPPPSR